MYRLILAALSAVLLISMTLQARGDDNAVPALERMSRLSSALKSFRYSDNGMDRIMVWRQSTLSIGSFSVTISDESTSLAAALECFEDECKPMDLTAIAILSDSGRTIRFVDMTDKKLKPERLELKRGQLVVLMAPQPPQ